MPAALMVIFSKKNQIYSWGLCVPKYMPLSIFVWSAGRVQTNSDKNMSKYRNPYGLLRASRRLENRGTNFVFQPPPLSFPDTV